MLTPPRTSRTAARHALRAAAVTAALLTPAGLAPRWPPRRRRRRRHLGHRHRHAHPGQQLLLPGPAEATFTVTATGQGSGAASTVAQGMRCGVTGQPFTVLILAPAGQASWGAPTSPSTPR